MNQLKFNRTCPDGTYITAYRPYDYLRSIGVAIMDIQQTDTKTEHLATLTISRALTAKEMQQVADICNNTQCVQAEQKVFDKNEIF